MTSATEAEESALSPVLDHGDFRPENLLVDDESVVAVLDWGNAQVTHHGFALARAEVRFVDRPARSPDERVDLQERFRTAYANHRPLPQFVEIELPRLK